MTKQQSIRPDMVHEYLQVYQNRMGRSSVMSICANTSPNTTKHLIKLLDDKLDEQSIPIESLAEFWEAFAFVFAEESARRIKSLGGSWWHVTGNSRFDFLFHEIVPHNKLTKHVIQSIKLHIDNDRTYDINLRLNSTFESVASFFNTHYFCQIEIQQLNDADNLLSFNVLRNSFAKDSDQQFMLFSGLIGEICTWLSSPILRFQVNVKLSTHNRIIIQHF